MSTATDNLWDGQWGLLRAFGWKKEESFLKRLPTNPTAQASDLLPAVGSPCPSGTPQRRIDVTAALAKEWLGGPLVYNKNFKLVDANAIMFVRTKETFVDHPGATEKAICDNADLAKTCWNKQNPEPLILRAAANECIYVTLTNKLHVEMPDTVRNVSDPKYKEYVETWSYNMLPPTVEGFNFNQFTSSNRVGLHPQLVAVNGNTEDGSFVGNNKNSTAEPDGGEQRYTWYAGGFTLKPKLLANGKKAWQPESEPIEFGAIALRDMADVIKHSSHGAIGALVIEPKGAQWQTDLEQGINQQSNAAATVRYVDAAGKPRQFREFVVLYQDDLSLQQNGQPMPNLRNGDDAEDTGQKAFNYRSEPIWARLGATPSANPETMNGYDWTDAFSSKVTQGTCVADPAHGKYCDPETPIFHANAGDQVRFRVVHPGGHPRNHGFTVFGHDWIMNPFVCGSDSKVMGWNQFGQNRIGSTSGVGPTRHINILTTAGGDFHTPGDYMYRTQEGFMFGGGLWGIFRVSPETGWHAGPPRMYCEN